MKHTILVNRGADISQAKRNKILENKHTINLTGELSTNQLRNKRIKRKFERDILPKIKSSVILVLSVLIMVLLWNGLNNNANASSDEETVNHDRFIAHFPLEKRVIGCYNDYTKETREDFICTSPGDKNITLPSRSDIVIWLKYYSEHQILNRLALVNYESNFNIYAVNDIAKGYVQTLKSHNIDIDIDSQLKWLKNRENKTYARKEFAGNTGMLKGCATYWNEPNIKDGTGQGEYGVLSCMYRFHYDANRGSWYGKRGIVTTKFYKKYMFGIK